MKHIPAVLLVIAFALVVWLVFFKERSPAPQGTVEQSTGFIE
jgi:hypothetical protein